MPESAEEFRQFSDQRFDRLNDYLTTMTDPMTDRGTPDAPYPATFDVATPDDASIVVRREFGAPPAARLAGETEPEHMRSGSGTPDLPIKTCELDVRFRGSYRWVFGLRATANGRLGTFDEVPPTTGWSPPSSSTPSPAPAPTPCGSPADDERTAIFLTVVYPSQESGTAGPPRG